MTTNRADGGILRRVVLFNRLLLHERERERESHTLTATSSVLTDKTWARNNMLDRTIWWAVGQ